MILVFTDCPFVDLTEQPGRVTRVLPDGSDGTIYCLVTPVQGDRLEASRPQVKEEMAIAAYRIICAFNGANGRIRAVGYSESGHAAMYDDVWTIEQARHAIEKGNRLYTVSPTTGAAAEIEVFGDSIRTKPEQTTDNSLDDLPRRG